MNSANPFPWFGPLDSFPHLRAVRRDPALLLTLSGEAFFYFLSTLLVLTINNPGAAELGFSYTLTSTLSVALLAGICGGSLLAARSTTESWRRLLVPVTMGIGLLLACVSLIPELPAVRQLFLLTVYALSGVCPLPQRTGKPLWVSCFRPHPPPLWSGWPFCWPTGRRSCATGPPESRIFGMAWN